MKYAALAAALAAVTLPEASGFSASGALPLRGSQLPSSKVCLLSCSSPALVAPGGRVRRCGARTCRES